MKRKQAAAMIMATVLAMGGILAGCGESKSPSTSSTAETQTASSSIEVEDPYKLTEDEEELNALPVTDKNVKLEDCVKIGNYKGLKLTKSIITPAEEDIKSLAEMNVGKEEVEDKNATVEKGDIVNIDYTGKIDGKTFDGGSDKGYELEIGSGMFIDGFEEGLIGEKAGVTEELNLRFPDDYGTDDLNGKDVVFTVTINSISRQKEVTDEDLKKAKDELESNAEMSAVDALRNDAWHEIIKLSEVFQLRQSDIDLYTEEVKEEIQAMMEMLGTDEAGYLEMQNMTKETFEVKKLIYAKEMAKEHLIVEALSNAEGISEDDVEQTAVLQKMADDLGSTIEEIQEQEGEETTKRYALLQRLLDRVISYANITEKKESAEEADEAAAKEEAEEPETEEKK